MTNAECFARHRELYTKDRRAVIRGAKLLDKLKPGWAKRLNMIIFTPNDPATCAWGQTFDCDAPAYVVRYSKHRSIGYRCDSSWLNLDIFWREEITKRRKIKRMRVK